MESLSCTATQTHKTIPTTVFIAKEGEREKERGEKTKY